MIYHTKPRPGASQAQWTSESSLGQIILIEKKYNYIILPWVRNIGQEIGTKRSRWKFDVFYFLAPPLCRIILKNLITFSNAEFFMMRKMRNLTFCITIVSHLAFAASFFDIIFSTSSTIFFHIEEIRKL